jgi:16S rRNA (cytidine1402-2'-O)-methyltransferase
LASSVNVVSAPTAGRLFVVSTPIGNMGDFSYRAVEVLREVRVVLAEDTRHSRHLLDRYEIGTPLAPYHEHNEAKATPALVARLAGGEDLALITDAGTPLLSDPGSRLVRAAIEADIQIVPIPGASALLPALVASGLDAERFTFFGFLPRKGKERASALAQLGVLPHTAVLYEAPSRLVDTLADLEAQGAGDRRAAVAREMTKQYEEIKRGTLSALRAYYIEVPPRGEIVLVIAGAPAQLPTEETVRDRARVLRASGLTTRDVAAALVNELGVSRNAAYRAAQEEA